MVVVNIIIKVEKNLNFRYNIIIYEVIDMMKVFYF